MSSVSQPERTPPPSGGAPPGGPPGDETGSPKGRIVWHDSPLAAGTARAIPVPAGGLSAVRHDAGADDARAGAGAGAGADDAGADDAGADDAGADDAGETPVQRPRTQIMLEPQRDPQAPAPLPVRVPEQTPVPAFDDPAATVPPLSPDGPGADLGSHRADDPSPFDHGPPFASGTRRRRNMARLWTIAALVFAALLLAAAAAVYSFGLPGWVLQRGGSQAHADLRLSFPAARQERRTLPSGADFFGASGTITNVGRTAQTVPALRLVLRDGHDRIVYQWEIAPPRRDLAPGESITINEARTDVPRSARFAEIGWKPE